MARADAGLRVLHVLSGAGGAAEQRWVALIGHWGKAVASTVAVAEGAGALPTLPAATRSSVQRTTLPNLAGSPGPRRLQALAEAMRGFDLILTFDWGARNAVLAHTLFGPRLGLPPLVHHFFQEDRGRALLGNLSRTVALARTQALVVPSARLEQVALTVWRQPPGKVHRIVPGVDTAAFSARPRADALPRVVKRKAERFIGAVAAADATPLLPLVRALAALPEPWQLVVTGDPGARQALLAEALARDLGHRVHHVGPVGELGRVIGLFDLFVATPGSDPLAVIGAMAAGLPVVGAAGDAAEFVAEANRPWLGAAGEALGDAVVALASDPGSLAAIGAANREQARLHHQRQAMLARHDALYAAVTGREAFP